MQEVVLPGLLIACCLVLPAPVFAWTQVAQAQVRRESQRQAVVFGWIRGRLAFFLGGRRFSALISQIFVGEGVERPVVIV